MSERIKATEEYIASISDKESAFGKPSILSSKTSMKSVLTVKNSCAESSKSARANDWSHIERLDGNNSNQTINTSTLENAMVEVDLSIVSDANVGDCDYCGFCDSYDEVHTVDENLKHLKN